MLETNQHFAKIWMIEDSELDIALNMRTFQLMKLDIDVTIFRDGGAVAARIKSDEQERNTDYVPDLIFLDLTLPKLSGMDLLARLKANPYYADVPVVILTGSTYVMDRENTMKKGAMTYINKPLRPEAFDQVIHDIPSLDWRMVDERRLLVKTETEPPQQDYHYM